MDSYETERLVLSFAILLWLAKILVKIFLARELPNIEKQNELESQRGIGMPKYLLTSI